jgi:hypothetical protein
MAYCTIDPQYWDYKRKKVVKQEKLLLGEQISFQVRQIWPLFDVVA